MTRSPERTLVGRWEWFWFEPIPPHVYALLRILFGSIGCIALLCLIDFPAFWDLTGIVPSAPWPETRAWMTAHGLAAISGRTVWALSLMAFAAMTVGYRCGVSVPFAFAAALVQSMWNSLPLSGAHAVMVGVFFCLIWADCGAVWSLDARRRCQQQVDPPRYTIAPLRLIRFQIAVIYLNTGFWKLFSTSWRDGSALHYVLNQNLFQRFSADTLPVSFEWLFTVGTYVTLVWELGFAVLILFRPTRFMALAIGIALHLGMLVSIDVGLFSFVMLASYAAFMDPDLVARFHPFRLRQSRAPFSDMRLTNKVTPVEE